MCSAAVVSPAISPHARDPRLFHPGRGAKPSKSQWPGQSTKYGLPECALRKGRSAHEHAVRPDATTTDAQH